MFIKKAHGLALAHKALRAFSIGLFLALWGFLTPTHVG